MSRQAQAQTRSHRQADFDDAGASAPPRLRLDKWLWAARFYKTRAIARKAVEGGKVSYDGSRCKPGKEVTVGGEVRLRQGFDEKTVIIKAVREQRRSAPEAQTLYSETPASIARRQLLAQQRRMQPRPPMPDTKPTKKQRRQIKWFRDGTNDRSAKQCQQQP